MRDSAGGGSSPARWVRQGGAGGDSPSTSRSESRQSRAAGLQGAGVSDTSECWRREARHFMVLTRAGKPVYTRVGDPAALAAFAGLLAGLSAVANSIGEDAKGGGGERCDALRGFRSAAGVRVAFLERGPLLLFALDAGASRTGFDGETTGSLRVQLGHLHAQVVSLVLGSAGLGRAFAAAGAGLDCAGLLGGTQGVFHALLARTEEIGRAHV